MILTGCMVIAFFLIFLNNANCQPLYEPAQGLCQICSTGKQKLRLFYRPTDLLEEFARFRTQMYFKKISDVSFCNKRREFRYNSFSFFLGKTNKVLKPESLI
jgi:hypothetical protein